MAAAAEYLWGCHLDNGFTVYDPATQLQLEAAYADFLKKGKPRKVRLAHGHFAAKKYVIYFDPHSISSGCHLHDDDLEGDLSQPFFVQMNKHTGFQRETRRVKVAAPAVAVEAPEEMDPAWFKDAAPPPDETCSICIDGFDEGKPVELTKCVGVHFFHLDCISPWLIKELRCPVCKSRYGVQTGLQPPNGTMMIKKDKRSLPGFEGYHTLAITYKVPSGVQGANHPSPGTKYHGTERECYLPASPEGEEVCKLLQIAFDRRLIFTIGQSLTTGQKNCVIWNGIHHKTAIHGGAAQHAFPDPGFLERVKDELAEKGVTPDDL